MKLWKLALAFFVCIVIFTLGSCDKGTDPDDNGDPPDTTDYSAPFILSWTPEDGAEEIPRGATLWVSICDTSGASEGLLADSIWMSVNSAVVSPALLNNACGGLNLRYIPPAPFGWGDTVTMSVRAVNSAGKSVEGEATFFVEIGDTFSFDFDTLPPIAGFITRSRPTGVTVKALYFASHTSPSYTELDGSPYHVTFSPNRSWILYDPGGNVWAANLASGLQVQLTNDPAEEKYPALSPNGNLLAFARGEDIILKNLQTDLERIISSTAQGGREMDFSPDGQYLAYRSGTSVNPKLFVRKVSDGDNIVYSSISNDISAFAWSRTHNGIACIVTGNRAYYWNVDGGTNPRLLRNADNIKYIAFDGLDNIYFVEQYPTGDKIMRSTTAGMLGLVLDLTPENATVTAIGVSDNGHVIFGKRTVGGAFSLEYIPASGTSSTTITDAVGNTLQIRWF
ncbi:MAG TPA: hypothetical protein ENN07_02685 [candidate division Zixibacteria bacterium]|nr:hypothetical protein [candidate division Zixibacteria bacterium]